MLQEDADAAMERVLEHVELVAPVLGVFVDVRQEEAAPAVDAARPPHPLGHRLWSQWTQRVRDVVFSMVLSMQPKSSSGNVCFFWGNKEVARKEAF